MEKDIVCNAFFSDNERYADIINGIGCKGIPFVSGKDLQESDTKVTPGPVNGAGRKRKGKTVKYRDLMRKASFGMNFAMIGIESQEKIDYALVLRTMGYDAGEYERQAATVRKKIRKECKNLDSGEYLYGFRKESRLFPTITFILYFGEEEWDGARNLHDILDFSGIPESLRELVADYRIHVVEVRKLEDTGVFRTDVKQVFDYIRFSGDKRKLRELVENDEAYGMLDEEAYDMVASYVENNEVLKIKEKYGKGGKVNMSKGLSEWLADERAEGHAEGKAEGRAEGKAEGHAEGKAEGRAEAIIDLLSGYGSASERLTGIIMKEKDLEILRGWLKTAAAVHSIEEFERKM